MSYDIIRNFRMSYETKMEWSFQQLFTTFRNKELPWMDWRRFSNLVFNLTDTIVQEQNFQPIIDEVWNHRQPEDYTGHNLKRGEFLRKRKNARRRKTTVFSAVWRSSRLPARNGVFDDPNAKTEGIFVI